MGEWLQNAKDFCEYMEIPEDDPIYPKNLNEEEAKKLVIELVEYQEELGNGDLATVKFYKEELGMNKNNYELVASVINGALLSASEYGTEEDLTFVREQVAEAMADALELDDNEFDRERFLENCGIKL